MSKPLRTVPVVRQDGRGCCRYVMADKILRVKEETPFPRVLVGSGLKGRPVWMRAQISLEELERRRTAANS